MDVKCKSEKFGVTISSILKAYGRDVGNAISEEAKKAAKALVKITKDTAPEKTGEFKKHIAAKENTDGGGWLWYVKRPEHAITHLIVRPRVKRDGTLSDPDPFLEKACEKVEADFAEELEKRIKKI